MLIRTSRWIKLARCSGRRQAVRVASVLARLERASPGGGSPNQSAADRSGRFGPYGRSSFGGQGRAIPLLQVRPVEDDQGRSVFHWLAHRQRTAHGPGVNGAGVSGNGVGGAGWRAEAAAGRGGAAKILLSKMLGSVA